MPTAIYTPEERAALMRELSDLESGSARQWFWLEAASSLPAPQLSVRTRRIRLLLRWLGPGRLLPLLQRAGIPAMALYQAAHQSRIERWQSVLNDALLGIGCVLAVCAGFGWLPASSQFAIWLACCGALLLAGWRTWRTPSRPESDFADEEALPGAEASIGLTGMLLARGCPAATAPVLVQMLRSKPDAALPLLVAALPELTEQPMHGKWLRWRTMLITWAGISLFLSKINGYTPIPWNHLASFSLLLGLALIARTRRPQIMLMLGAWAGAAALAWLLRLL
ncbi:hypothetical protein [Chitinilyticum aquatile]|uniref:hypothetical protein n=1 Tax=Chitinilyticum aquatile TaxID=362520 RepID=UPI0004265020|nr:hypothetical protein [Chitinilyticum aquatile]